MDLANQRLKIVKQKINELWASPAEAPKTHEFIKFGPGQPEAENSRLLIKVYFKTNNSVTLQSKLLKPDNLPNLDLASQRLKLSIFNKGIINKR